MDEIVARFFENLGSRVGGPLTFRMLLQPLVVTALAIRSGIKDARAGRPAYGWAVMSDPHHRAALLRDGWSDIAKVFVMALVIDVVYQLIVERWVYPGETVLVAVLLAIVPYLLIRGPASRIARLAMRRPSAKASSS